MDIPVSLAREGKQNGRIDERLRDEIRRIAGVPATTATNSIFAACKKLSMKRVTAISPHSEAGHRFFAEGGIETARISILLTGSALPSRHPRRSSTWP